MIAIDQEQVLERMPLKAEIDIVHIRQLVRLRGKEYGMGLVDQTRITTAASEILRNMYVHARGGEATISLVTVQGRRGLLVTCRDEGPGIPGAEQKAAMMEPFVRGEAARSMDDRTGFGLGLSIAHAIVVAHGGTLVLSDREPRGLIVRIALPVASGAPASG